MSDSESDERLWGGIGAIGAIFFAIIGAIVGGWIAGASGAIWGAIIGASVGGIIVAFVGAIYHDEQRFRSGLILGAIAGAIFGAIHGMIRPATVDEWLRSLGIRDPFLDGWIGGDGGWILGAIVGAILGAIISVIPHRHP